MKNLIIASLMTLTTFANAADSGLDPQNLKVKVYRFAVSTSEYCTNPQVVFTNANPDYEDLLSSPTFGTGSIANGIYKCVILEVSDQLTFSPAENSDSGACNIGQEVTMDICREESTKSIEGVSSNCQVGEDKVTLYLSIVSTDVEGAENGVEAFSPPSAGSHNFGIKLTGALSIAGPRAGTFVINGKGKVLDYLEQGTGQRHCEMMPPQFKFH